jgi:hypothetical protein
MKKIFLIAFLLLWVSFIYSQPNPPNLLIPPNGALNVPIHPTLDWNAVPGATGYILHVSKSPLFDSLVVCDTIPLGIITLEYNTTYYWRVCAMNSGGVGPWSSVWNFTTTGQIPLAPVLLSPPDSSMISVVGQVFDWSDVPTATSYRIQISTSSNFSTTVLNIGGLTNSGYIIASAVLMNSTLYYWRVNASNANGTSPWSSVWRIITALAPPLTPMIYPVNRGKPIYSDSATIFEWHKVLTATSYRIQISTSSPFPNPFINEVVYDTLFIAPPGTFTSNVLYYWRVNASNSGGASPWTSVWSFTVAPGPPNSPLLLSPLNNATNVSLTPTLDWYDVSGATSYRVQVSQNQNFNNLIVNTTTSSSSSHYTILSGVLSNNTKYYWRVNASNIGGTSYWSDVWNFTTLNQIGISLISSEVPSEYKLYNNYPNPFNPATNIKYQIPNNKFTTLKIYDILGKEVITLVNEFQKAGTYEIQFSIDQFTSNQLPSGIYFYTIRSGDFTDTKKMLMIK